MSSVKKRFTIVILLIIVILVIAGYKKKTHSISQNTEASTSDNVMSFKILVSSGGRADWSHSTDQIVFDSNEESSFYQIYTMSPDGTDKRCLTCSFTSQLAGNNGNPSFSPDGKWILFQAEKNNHPGPHLFSTPGLGAWNDLWIMDSEGKEIYKLVTVPADSNAGILHPRFSPDGKQISWSQMYAGANLLKKGQEFGYWKIHVADFSVTQNGPAILNEKEYQPGVQGMYENAGFSEDGKSLLFMSTLAGGPSLFEEENIFLYNMEDNKLTQLTSEGYNEHPVFSPDYQSIVWMHSTSQKKGTEYWQMNLDGTNKEQLTHLNDEGYDESMHQKVYAAHASFSNNPKKFVGYIQTDLVTQKGQLAIIELK